MVFAQFNISRAGPHKDLQTFTRARLGLLVALTLHSALCPILHRWNNRKPFFTLYIHHSNSGSQNSFQLDTLILIISVMIG